MIVSLSRKVQAIKGLQQQYLVPMLHYSCKAECNKHHGYDIFENKLDELPAHSDMLPPCFQQRALVWPDNLMPFKVRLSMASEGRIAWRKYFISF